VHTNNVRLEDFIQVNFQNDPKEVTKLNQINNRHKSDFKKLGVYNAIL